MSTRAVTVYCCVVPLLLLVGVGFLVRGRPPPGGRGAGPARGCPGGGRHRGGEGVGGPRRVCPWCGRANPPGATTCRACRRFLPAPSDDRPRRAAAAIAPDAAAAAALLPREPGGPVGIAERKG